MVVAEALTLALAPVTKALDKLTSTLKESVAFSDKAQKASLGLGMDLVQTREKLGPSIEGLRGTIQQKFTGGLMALEQGLRGNLGGVNKLINQQMLTGTQYEGTAKAFARLQVFAGLNTEALNQLSEDTINLQSKYGVTTDRLVDAVKSLEKNFIILDMLGMSKGMTGAVAELGAKLGPQFIDRLPELMNMLLQTGTKGLGDMAALGIQDLRQQLQAVGDDSEAAFDILVRNIEIGAEHQKVFSHSMLGMGAQAETGLRLGSLLHAANEKLISGLTENEEATQKWGNTMENMRAEVWEPLRKVVLDNYDKLLEFYTILTKVVKVFVGRFSLWFESILPAKKALDGFAVALVDAVIVGVDSFGHLLDKGEVVFNWLGGILEMFGVAIVGVTNMLANMELISLESNWNPLFRSIIDVEEEIAEARKSADMSFRLQQQGFEVPAFGDPDVFAEVHALERELASMVARQSELRARGPRGAAGVGSVMDQLAAALAALESDVGEGRFDPTIVELRKLRADIKAGTVDAGEAADRLAELQAETRDRLPRPEEQMSFWQDESVRIIGGSIERILGITPGSRDLLPPEVVEILAGIEANTAVRAARTGAHPGTGE